MLLKEACSVTVASCAEFISGPQGNQSVTAVVEQCLWGRPQLHQLIDSVLTSIYYCTHLRVGPALCATNAMLAAPSFPNGATLVERAAAGDDVFLLPGHATALFLWKLSKWTPSCAVREHCSVALDTQQLADYQAIRNASGTSITRLFWHGKAPHRLAVPFRRAVLLCAAS
jgi:hypothetical protein